MTHNPDLVAGFKYDLLILFGKGLLTFMDHPVDCPLVCSLSFESVESHRMTDPCFGRLITSAIMDDNDRLKLLEQLGERISDIEPLPREDFFTRTDTCVFQCLRRDSLGLTFWSATFSYALYYLHE